jgi:hypothetical protein
LGLPLESSSQGRRIHQVHPHDEENGSHGRFHSAAPAKIVRSHEGWEVVEGQNQPLARYKEIDYSCSGNDGEDQEKFFVNVAKARNECAFHGEAPANIK